MPVVRCPLHCFECSSLLLLRKHSNRTALSCTHAMSPPALMPRVPSAAHWLRSHTGSMLTDPQFPTFCTHRKRLLLVFCAALPGRSVCSTYLDRLRLSRLGCFLLLHLSENPCTCPLSSCSVEQFGGAAAPQGCTVSLWCLCGVCGCPNPEAQLLRQCCAVLCYATAGCLLVTWCASLKAVRIPSSSSAVIAVCRATAGVHLSCLAGPPPKPQVLSLRPGSICTGPRAHHITFTAMLARAACSVVVWPPLMCTNAPAGHVGRQTTLLLYITLAHLWVLQHCFHCEKGVVHHHAESPSANECAGDLQ